MSKVNLLYIIEGGPIGGAERNLLTVIGALDKTRYNIKVCLLNPSVILERELKELSVSFSILEPNSKFSPFSIPKLIRLIRREKIDIAHTCLHASNTFGRIAAILARVPIIIAWEQGEILDSVQPARHYLMDRILARLSDTIVSCSQTCKDEIIRKEGIAANKIRVIYNCIDLSRFSSTKDPSGIRRELGIGQDDILLGTVATLDDEKKGQGYAIMALPQIARNFPNAKLLLVGRDGSSKSRFMQIAESFNVKDRVIFTGFRQDIPDIINALDIYVCPSLREGISLSLLEAMAFRKAIVSTNAYGNAEIVVNEQTGYLVVSKDQDSIARAVIDMLSDKEKMRSMGIEGYQRVKKYFSSDVVIKQIDDLYQELLCKKHLKQQ
jgi:glycosyltransferase involved in cell wall biosynthesis